MNTQRDAGFTLVEIIIVLAIASVLSLGVMQGWRSWQQRQQLQDSVSQVRQFLLALRSEAGWNNRTLLLWSTAGSPWCIGAPPDARGLQRRLCAPWPDVMLVRVTPDIGFYGRRDVARPGSLTFQNPAGVRRVIVASRGRIRICQPEMQGCDP